MNIFNNAECGLSFEKFDKEISSILGKIQQPDFFTCQDHSRSDSLYELDAPKPYASFQNEHQPLDF